MATRRAERRPSTRPRSCATASGRRSRSCAAPRTRSPSTSASCARRPGLVTFDPGFGNTGACRSSITYIDGEKGILRYRGYPIEELAEKSSFLEVAWLLIHGELPTRAELATFAREITRHTMLHEDFQRFFGALPKDAHPMPVCAATVGALATYYQEQESERAMQISVVRLLAKMPTIAAWSYKHSIGQPFMYPRNHLDYASNFLHMMFATPCEEYMVDPGRREGDRPAPHPARGPRAELLDVDGAPRRELAGEPVRGDLGRDRRPVGPAARRREPEGDRDARADRARGRLGRSLPRPREGQERHDAADGVRHRIYKSYDPRAAVLKKTCAEVIAKLGTSSRLLEIAMRLEEIALQDDYFVSRKLYPNVDFYSGVIYQALSIPTNMFTVMFAMGRLPGWIAHFLEMRRDPDFRIGRPRQIYMGSKKRAYVSMDKRG
jgi:citrate synthase